MSFAEFIPARIDTKQRLGELFIQHPTKLEMFGLRQVSSKPPKFEHHRPLFELPETSRSTGDSMQLSHPQLIATERKEPPLPSQKRLQSHHGRLKNELPPILAHPHISPPPFQMIAAKTERKQKSLGKLSFGRLSKRCEIELIKHLTEQMDRQFGEPARLPKGALLKYQNLKRSKQVSLSQAIKEFKKTQISEDKSSMVELFRQKEKELNSLISGFEANSIDDII